MQFPDETGREPGRDGTLSQPGKVIAFTLLVFASGAAFATVAGTPRLPADELPQPRDVLAILSGSTLPVQPLVAVLVDLVWLIWIWIVASLGLEILLAAAEVIAGGAAWIASLRRLVDRCSMPLVRRVVATAFTIQVLSRGVPIAAAQTLQPPETSLVAGATSHADPRIDVETDDTSSATPIYLVQPGDTLWSISERAYGTGAAYRRIVDANLGLRMPNGQVFSSLGVIQPGWLLRLPGAGRNVEEVDGACWYIVQPGDSLSAIAGVVLGDSTRWQELFELNAHSTTSDGLHALVDPDVIWPGLRLRLPGSPDPARVIASAIASVDAASDPAPPAPDSRTEGATDLVAASTAATTPTDVPPQPRELDASGLPPLLRTAHVWDPVVLESSDTLSVEAPADDTLPSASDAEVSVPPAPARPEVPIVPLAVGGLGLAVVAGMAFGARHVRRLRPLPRMPENDVVVQGGFAEAQLAHDLARGVHGVGFDPIATLVGQLQRFLAEYNLDDVRPIAVRHGNSSTTITLGCNLGQQQLVVDLAPAFAEQLGAEVETAVSSDQDVQVKLLRLRNTRLLPTAESVASSPCLLPLGLLFDKQIFSATWDGIGHILVVSVPQHGADTILTSLVATITARRPPEQVRIWMVAPPRALPAPLFEVPHLARLIDPASEQDLERLRDDLRAELERRAAHRQAGEPDLVVVISELSALGAHAEHLSLLAAHAAELGVRFVAASRAPDDALLSPLLQHFETRMVLRMHTEEISVALLGVADAAFLSGGGRLFVRIDGRQPVELYGFQVSPEHLERLVKMMRSVYRSIPPPTRPPADTSSATPPAPPAQEASHPSDAFGGDPATSVAQPAASPPIAVATKAALPLIPADNANRPPVEVICFGGPRVLCAGQAVWPKPVSGDAKPWEFLLYLACQPAEGAARDEVADALWPEDETPDTAAHRFRQLRYRLRRMLNEVPGGPPTDGVSFERGVFRLDPGIVHSDVQEFLEIIRRARVNPPADLIAQLERARELYSGDLLEGPDARRYAWVDERDSSGVTLREHFRRQFHQASTRLAELYADAGETDESVAVYRELSEIDPSDERLWQALFRLHARRGDRLALVREERHMCEALRMLADELGTPDPTELIGPSDETAQEYQRLLASLADRDREPLTA